MNEKFFRRLEQDTCSPPPSPTNVSMFDSLQNLVQRFIKPTTSSSTPSTPKCSSHHDQFSFRIRPFPMSSFDNQTNETTNLNPLNKRFYHVFKHGELELLIHEASKSFNEIQIRKSYYDHGNWCAIVQKIS